MSTRRSHDVNRVTGSDRVASRALRRGAAAMLRSPCRRRMPTARLRRLWTSARCPSTGGGPSREPSASRSGPGLALRLEALEVLLHPGLDDQGPDEWIDHAKQSRRLWAVHRSLDPGAVGGRRQDEVVLEWLALLVGGEAEASGRIHAGDLHVVRMVLVAGDPSDGVEPGAYRWLAVALDRLDPERFRRPFTVPGHVGEVREHDLGTAVHHDGPGLNRHRRPSPGCLSRSDHLTPPRSR